MKNKPVVKEKAEELVRKFALGGCGEEHAITCVDEIISANPRYVMFWVEVKEELKTKK